MRELDELLTGYLANRYELAAASEKEAFQTLLTLSDPQLVSYLLQKETPTPDIAFVVRHILDRTDA